MKYLNIVLVLLICAQSFAKNDIDNKPKPNTALEQAYHQKEIAILQLNSSKDFYKVVKTLELTNNNLVISSSKYEALLDKYGSECETACVDINQYVISIVEDEEDYTYIVDKSELQRALKNQIKYDKRVKHEKCCCYRKTKRNCKKEE